MHSFATILQTRPERNKSIIRQKLESRLFVVTDLSRKAVQTLDSQVTGGRRLATVVEMLQHVQLQLLKLGLDYWMLWKVL